MNIQERVGSMSRPLQVLVALTAVLSVGAVVTSIGPALDGEAYGFARIALGVIGVIGVGLVLFGSDYGKTGLVVILAWAAIQSVYYATEPDGNITRQVVDGLIGVSSETTINGEVTEYSGTGVNLVGLAMFALAWYCREKVVDWKNRATRGFSV